ncbi:MAG: lytic transglycosylase domain-containing protein [Deltaproteobacteria bacterium]|jgi:soluble lytic murein transglycosylase-like protein|nr:lytic transglycosylase domain-containing protein [Deltaproteobacteria bacterium]
MPFPFFEYIKAIRLRAVLAVSAVGIAIVPALIEHKAREQESPQVKTPILKHYGDTAENLPTVQLYGSLKFDPNLLAQVNSQVRKKPTFNARAQNYEDIILEAAQANFVSPVLVMAVIQAESNFNSAAISSQGAVGLMQVLPSTARSVGVTNPQVPRNNILAGVRYLRTLLDEFGDEEYLALAAYNCGPEIIKRYGNRLPPYNETRKFVAVVMDYYQAHIES